MSSAHQHASAALTADAPKKGFDFTSLMSPPDPTPLDSFNHSAQVSPMATPAQAATEDALRMPMSPPVSPLTKAANNNAAAAAASHTEKDPILYPRDDLSLSPPQQPLFPANESASHRRLVDEHIASRDTTTFRRSPPPKREEYELVLQFRSKVIEMYSKDPQGWLKREKKQLVLDRKTSQNRADKRYIALAPAKSTKLSAKVSATKTVRTPAAKPDRVVKPAHGPRPAPAVARARPTNPTPKKTRVTSATPEPSRRIVAPNREDRDFASLPDLCPPLSSLPDKTNSLKVDWKGTAVDLSNDPNAHHLHPDEVTLAAALRLDCATYLTSKRRIFIRRLECARIQKEFRKTDAQQACKIDVNKASKLWTAFDKVGWLDIKWMAPFASSM
ncbi:SWIRM domain-containing protein FUN19 like [Verticillium longisporum]|uniref:SWIRM domain-containing protein FUN19 like n=2 Tax=Verticillium longisporum TaxID=100787 RepID=A0A8I2ZZM8_VERLO|nr:SWIRM domain-containing protein FUN19 like [Verticillium longisporum]